MKKILLLLIVLCFCKNRQACAQSFDGVRISLKAGAGYSMMDNLQTTILSEPYFTNYSLTGKKVSGFTGGIGINSEIKNSVFALNLDVLYSQEGSELNFNNTAKDFNYRMQFKYRYINLPLLLKAYPFDRTHDGLHGINLGVGPQLGFNIAPENIIYTSGGTGKLPAFGTDLEQQQQISNVLKGKNNFGVLFHAGYDIPNIGLNIAFSYLLGLSDGVETLPNAYNFIENKNTNKTLQVTLGWELFSTYPKKRVLIVRPAGS